MLNPKRRLGRAVRKPKPPKIKLASDGSSERGVGGSDGRDQNLWRKAQRKPATGAFVLSRLSILASSERCQIPPSLRCLSSA